MRYLLLLSLLICCLLPTGTAQNTTGLVYADAQTTPGYVLFENRFGNFLIDECGRVVHTWNFVGQSRLHTKLLPNGHLIHINAATRSVDEYAWDGQLISSTLPQDPDILLDYEVIVLPNGNYLCLGRRSFSMADFTAIGYDLSGIGRPQVVDVVVEMIPLSGEIVWEWNIADHVVQFRDPTAPNYGDPSNHPELLNMDRIAIYDWTFYESFMINGMDYNPALDQIALSVRKLSEVVIIDHSTTTEEAAGSTGGNSGSGGDILYRWGNPQNYGQGGFEDRQLYFQHNPNWIKYGEWAGALMVFNNGLNRPDVSPENIYSEVVIIQPPVDNNGQYTLQAGEAFAPLEPNHTYGSPSGGPQFYSGYTSGARTLPNGHIMVTVGQTGQLLELRPDGSLSWEYRIPNNGYIFRCVKYPPDYPAFIDRDLNPGGPAPNTTSTYACPLVSTSEEPSATPSPFWVSYLPTSNQLHVDNPQALLLHYRLFSLQGQLLLQGSTQEWTSSHQLPSLVAGTYIVQMLAPGEGERQSFKIIIPQSH